MKRMLRIGAVLLVTLLGSGLADTSLFGTMALAGHGNGNGQGNGRGNGQGNGWGHEAMKGNGARDFMPPAWSRPNRPDHRWWRNGKGWSFGRRSVPVHRRVRRGWDKKAKHHAYGHRRSRKRYHWPRPIA